MNKLFFIFLLGLLTITYSVDINTCTNISHPGYYRLVSDISTSGASCIEINTSNISFDLNGYSVSCDGGDGIDIMPSGWDPLTNITIFNGDITHSDIDLYISHSNITIENVTMTDGSNVGLFLDSLSENEANLSNVSIKNSWTALYISSVYSTNISVSGLNILNSTYTGVAVESPSNSLIEISSFEINETLLGINISDQSETFINLSDGYIKNSSYAGILDSESFSSNISIFNTTMQECHIGILINESDGMNYTVNKSSINSVEEGLFVDNLYEVNWIRVDFSSFNGNKGFNINTEDGSSWDALYLIFNELNITSATTGLVMHGNSNISLNLSHGKLEGDSMVFYSQAGNINYIVKNASFKGNEKVIYLPYPIHIQSGVFYPDFSKIEFYNVSVNGKPAIFTSDESSIPSNFGFDNFVNADNYGYIGLIDMRSVYVRGNLPEDVDRGLLLWNVSNGLIEVNASTYPLESILIVDSSNITITDSNITNITVYDYTYNLVVNRSYLNGYGSLFFMKGGQFENISIKNNHIVGANTALLENTTRGIYFYSLKLNNVSVFNNTIEHVGVGTRVLILNEVRAVKIFNNTILNTNVAIWSLMVSPLGLIAPNEINFISGNHISNSTVGIRAMDDNNNWLLGASFPFIQITNNTISDVVSAFQIIDGGNCYITNSNISNSSICIDLGRTRFWDDVINSYVFSSPAFNIYMRNITCFDTGDYCVQYNGSNYLRNLNIANITCSNGKTAINLTRISGLTVENSTFEGFENGLIISETWWKSGELTNGKGIRFVNTVMEVAKFAFNVTDIYTDELVSPDNGSIYIHNVSVSNPAGSLTPFTVFDFISFDNGVINFTIAPSSFSETPSANLTSFGDKRLLIETLPSGGNITNISFYWNDTESSSINESSIELWRYHSDVWEQPGSAQSLDTVNNVITAYNVTNGSIYGLYASGSGAVAGPPPEPKGTKPTELSVEVICNEG